MIQPDVKIDKKKFKKLWPVFFYLFIQNYNNKHTHTLLSDTHINIYTLGRYHGRYIMYVFFEKISFSR